MGDLAGLSWRIPINRIRTRPEFHLWSHFRRQSGGHSGSSPGRASPEDVPNVGLAETFARRNTVLRSMYRFPRAVECLKQEEFFMRPRAPRTILIILGVAIT